MAGKAAEPPGHASGVALWLGHAVGCRRIHAEVIGNNGSNRPGEQARQREEPPLGCICSGIRQLGCGKLVGRARNDEVDPLQSCKWSASDQTTAVSTSTTSVHCCLLCVKWVCLLGVRGWRTARAWRMSEDGIPGWLECAACGQDVSAGCSSAACSVAGVAAALSVAGSFAGGRDGPTPPSLPMGSAQQQLQAQG